MAMMLKLQNHGISQQISFHHTSVSEMLQSCLPNFGVCVTTLNLVLDLGSPILHNIIHIHNSVLWNCQYSTEYSSCSV